MTLRLTVIGTGYLGATHAACMAELGFEVLGVDVDKEKIDSLSRGELPIHEPGLPELLRKHTASGRLRFTTSFEEAGAFGDVHFIAVGTPQRAGEHAADMTYVDASVAAIARAATKDSLIVGKSTVPVGSARRLKGVVAEEARDGVTVNFAWNPEFLREGFAVEDTLRPDRLVIGVDSASAEATLREVYADAISRETPFISTDFETAELVKVAANAFLATKISFINASPRSPRPSAATSAPWPTQSASTPGSAAASSTPASASAAAACPRTSGRSRHGYPSSVWTAPCAS